MKTVEFAGRQLTISEVRSPDGFAGEAVAPGWGDTMPPAFASMLALQAAHHHHYQALALMGGMGSLPYSVPAWQPPYPPPLEDAAAPPLLTEAAVREPSSLARAADLPLPIPIPPAASAQRS